MVLLHPFGAPSYAADAASPQAAAAGYALGGPPAAPFRLSTVDAERLGLPPAGYLSATDRAYAAYAAAGAEALAAGVVVASAANPPDENPGASRVTTGAGDGNAVALPLPPPPIVPVARAPSIVASEASAGAATHELLIGGGSASSPLPPLSPTRGRLALGHGQHKHPAGHGFGYGHGTQAGRRYELQAAPFGAAGDYADAAPAAAAASASAGSAQHGLPHAHHAPLLPHQLQAPVLRSPSAKAGCGRPDLYFENVVRRSLTVDRQVSASPTGASARRQRGTGRGAGTGRKSGRGGDRTGRGRDEGSMGSRSGDENEDASPTGIAAGPAGSRHAAAGFTHNPVAAAPTPQQRRVGLQGHGHDHDTASAERHSSRSGGSGTPHHRVRTGAAAREGSGAEDGSVMKGGDGASSVASSTFSTSGRRMMARLQRALADGRNSTLAPLWRLRLAAILVSAVAFCVAIAVAVADVSLMGSYKHLLVHAAGASRMLVSIDSMASRVRAVQIVNDGLVNSTALENLQNWYWLQTMVQEYEAQRSELLTYAYSIGESGLFDGKEVAMTQYSADLVSGELLRNVVPVSLTEALLELQKAAYAIANAAPGAVHWFSAEVMTLFATLERGDATRDGLNGTITQFARLETQQTAALGVISVGSYVSIMALLLLLGVGVVLPILCWVDRAKNEVLLHFTHLPRAVLLSLRATAEADARRVLLADDEEESGSEGEESDSEGGGGGGGGSRRGDRARFGSAGAGEAAAWAEQSPTPGGRTPGGAGSSGGGGGGGDGSKAGAGLGGSSSVNFALPSSHEDLRQLALTPSSASAHPSSGLPPIRVGFGSRRGSSQVVPAGAGTPSAGASAAAGRSGARAARAKSRADAQAKAAAGAGAAATTCGGVARLAATFLLPLLLSALFFSILFAVRQVTLDRASRLASTVFAVNSRTVHLWDMPCQVRVATLVPGSGSDDMVAVRLSGARQTLADLRYMQRLINMGGVPVDPLMAPAARQGGVDTTLLTSDADLATVRQMLGGDLCHSALQYDLSTYSPALGSAYLDQIIAAGGAATPVTAAAASLDCLSVRSGLLAKGADGALVDAIALAEGILARREAAVVGLSGIGNMTINVTTALGATVLSQVPYSFSDELTSPAYTQFKALVSQYIAAAYGQVGRVFEGASTRAVDGFLLFEECFVSVFIALFGVLIVGWYLPSVTAQNQHILKQRTMLLYLPHAAIKGSPALSRLVRDILQAAGSTVSGKGGSAAGASSSRSRRSSA